MVSLRGFAAVLLGISLCAYPIQAALNPPLGILTQAQDAQLNSAAAFPGLSVYEGEMLSTGQEGMLGVRVGPATLVFSRGAVATLQKVQQGTHVDLSCGSVFFATPQNRMVEVHAADAVFRPELGILTQAEVRVIGAKILEVSAVHGNLEFSYLEEYQLLREGKTYRIELDAPAEPQKPAGAGAPSIGPRKKTVFYIFAGGGAAGLIARGIHELVEEPESPSNPSKPQ